MTFPQKYAANPLVSCYITYGGRGTKDARVKIGAIYALSQSGFTVDISDPSGDIANDAYEVVWYAIGIKA